MKLYIRPFLSFALALLLTTTPAFAGTRGGGNNGSVRSSSRANVNQPSGAKNAASNRNTNNNRIRTKTNVNRNTNVNKNNNVNVNKNTNVNVNRDVNVNTHSSYNSGYYGGGGCCYHSGVGTAVAVAAATTATAMVVGSMVHSLPPNCSAIVANGVTYQQCGGTYYQPQFSGGNTTYVVVNQP